LFTAGNIFLGFYALLEILQGSLDMVSGGGPSVVHHFQYASIAIGWAVFLDGLDGRIARTTNTVSDFGREMDSLADLVTFGLAPAVMAFAWGVRFVDVAVDKVTLDYLHRGGYFVAFLYLICGAARLARFNVQKNPIPKNPGRADRKYFVGLPIPAAAGMVASVIYAADSEPITNPYIAGAWLGLLGLLAFLMISTWRYPSFKGVNLLAPRSFMTFVFLASFIFLVAQFTQPVLLGMSICYVGSGIAIRIGGILRRKLRNPPRHPEHQVG
jgi:CDP-diacylglycerol--serine O-phosphatidyltransferase